MDWPFYKPPKCEFLSVRETPTSTLIICELNLVSKNLNFT